MPPTAKILPGLISAAIGIGCATSPDTFEPIEGADVAPIEQAQAACESARAKAKPRRTSKYGDIGSPGTAAAQARAEYEACMAEQGWTVRKAAR